MVVAASVIVGVTSTMRADAAGESGSLRQLERVLPAKVTGPTEVPGADKATPPMIVDTKHHLGFAIGTDPADTLTKLVMYDLKDLRVLDTFPIGTARPEDIYAFVIDPDAQRLIDAGPFFSLGNPQNFVCREQFGTLLSRYDYGSGKLDDDLVQMPCSGAYGFMASSGSLYKTKSSTKLLLTGTYTPEGPRNADPSLGLAENDGQAILIRQLDLGKMYGATTWQQSLDWEIDLRYAGCGRREVFFATRVDDSILSYCSDPRPGPAKLAIGEQGYVVRIPLGPDDRPLTETVPSTQNPADPSAPPLGGGSSPAVPNPTDPVQQPDQTKLTNPAYQQQYLSSPTYDQFIANPVIRRTPALPGEVFPFVDPSSGNVLLLTANTFNGSAVWVFDPRAERFVGLITGGFVSQSDTQTAAGFDPVRGRAYLLTAGGVLAASTRQRPLPPGKVWPVARSHTNGEGQSVPNTVDFRDLAVDPGLQRIFVPVTDVGYVVLEDDVVDPKGSTPLDPDTLTKQVNEEPGVTDVDKSGAALASGARILVTGGIPRVVDQADPFCLSPSPAFDQFAFERGAFGDCLADQFVTKGNRDVSLAATKISTGTATGATAEASGLFVPPTERATSADLENAGACFERTFIGLSAGGAKSEDFEGYQQFCGGLQGGLYQATKDDLRNGTRGGEQGVDEDGDGKPDNDPAPGKGFPVPAAACDDFGGRPSTVGEPTTQPKSAAFNATVTCQAVDVTAAATASGSAIAIPGPVDPLISVARTESDVVSHPSDSGQVTKSSAIASGVRIGPLEIGTVKSEATSIGKGRTGTAKARYSRVWCGISLSGVLVEEGCVDPMSPDAQRLIDQVNQGLGKVRITVPAVDASATSGGYQAVITKAEDIQAADRSVNDDDSITVPGLQVTLYNDGSQGRSRTILQLANVEAESRYAIVLLPAFDIPFFPELAFVDDPVVEARALAATAEPPRFKTIPAIPASFTSPVRTPTIFGRVAPAPLQALANIFGWLRNNLREAALLFLLLAILALPAYLFLRRRAFERAMVG